MTSEPTDSELLAAFARGRDQAAFARIVDRHGALVYSAALRQVGPALADDVSQAVFFILAKKAHRVDGRTLAGWLVNAARFTALASRRTELRLKQREHKAALMKHESSGAGTTRAVAAPDWESLAPFLDQALSRLREKDRTVVTLRYLEGKSMREIAVATSLTEAAVGKRASRAVQALRDYFARRGVSLSADSLAGALAVHGIVALPVGLAGKLAATAAGGAAAAAGGTLSAGAAGIVKGALPLMAATKTQTAAAVLVASLLVVGGGGALIATLRPSVPPRPGPAALLPPAEVIRVVAGVAGAPLGPPATAPALPERETLTRFLTPPGSRASFAGRVEGLVDPGKAQVGIVSLRGNHWLSNDNYQWQPVNPDGTFAITAGKHPLARRALAVRAAGWSTTFLRAEFGAAESARAVVLRMKPVRPITVVANDSRGRPVSSLRVEVFDPSIGADELRTDDYGRGLVAQQLDVRTTAGNALTLAVPLEPVTLFIGGTGVASHVRIIDPRHADRFEFHLLVATCIEGTVTRAGTPVAGARMMLNNDAEPLSYVVRKTDAKGYFRLTNGVPGTYTIAVGGKTVRVPLVEGTPAHVTIDLAAIDGDGGTADVAAAAPSVFQSSP